MVSSHEFALLAGVGRHQPDGGDGFIDVV